MGAEACIDGVMDGDPRDSVLAVRAFVAGNAIKVIIEPNPLCVGTFFAHWVNAVWQGPNDRAPLSGNIERISPFDPGTDVASIWVEQCGVADTFDPSFIPSDYAEYWDSLTANRLRIKWTVPYALTPVNGDSQLSSITVTGARRNGNVESVEDSPYRGRLFYTITTVGSDHFVRWYANGILVAAGPRTGNGAVTCAETNNSGLSIACSITYSAEVTLNTAWLDVVWPERYQIHYVRNTTLSFPRAYQALVNDNGKTEQKYRSPILASGDYDFNVLGMDDAGGNVAASPPPAGDTPKTINAPPLPPIITSVTGNAGTGLTVNWTLGETGVTTKLYYAVDGPINFGHLTAPTPIGPTAVNATSAALPAFSAPPHDNTTDYDDVSDAFDDVAADMNTAFDSGETGFIDALDLADAALAAALVTYADALGKRLQDFIDVAAGACARLRETAAEVEGVGLTSGEWTIAVAPAYSQFLAMLGGMVDGNPNRYTLPDGSLPGTLPDGSEGLEQLGGDNLFTAGAPLVRNAVLRIVARHTKGGVEDLTDTVYAVELDSAGDGVATRPNRASIQSISSFDETFNVVAAVQEGGSFAAATSVEILVDGSAAASASLPAIINNFHQVTIPVTVSNGWHKIAARAISAAGSRSIDYHEQSFYFGGSFTEAVEDLKANVVRGLG